MTSGAGLVAAVSAKHIRHAKQVRQQDSTSALPIALFVEFSRRRLVVRFSPMALIVCPECRSEMSDTAAACPKCGWARAAILAAEHHARQMTAKGALNAEGKRLVSLSTKLMLLGFAIWAGTCLAAMVARNAALAVGVGSIAGLAVLVAAAVVGQIGRAKQGRIV